MKKIIFILLFLPFLAKGQNWLQMGNTLQRKVIAPGDTIWRFALGSPGFLSFSPHGGGGSGSTTYSLTINNSGSGTASPFTFNGGTVGKVISWNSIGAFPLIFPSNQTITMGGYSAFFSGGLLKSDSIKVGSGTQHVNIIPSGLHLNGVAQSASFTNDTLVFGSNFALSSLSTGNNVTGLPITFHDTLKTTNSPVSNYDVVNLGYGTATYQPLLGFTPENVANKTATASTSTTTYPNWLGVENYVTGLGYVTPSSTTSFTNKDLTGAGNTFPTFNQNTTGSAAKLTTARNINGVAFDGTGNITITANTPNALSNGFGINSLSYTGASALSIVADTTTALVGKVRYNADYANITTSIATKQQKLTLTAVKTANYTLAAFDYAIGNATAGTFTFTLPTAPADGTLVGVKMVNTSGTNAISLATGGSDVFNGGGTTASLTLNYQAITFQYKLSSNTWYSINTNLALGLLDARYAATNATAGGDLTGTYPNPTINTINSITKSFYDPTSSIQTQLNTKLSANQSITFTPTGDVTGTASGATSLTPALTIGAGKVTNAMLAGSIDLTSKVTGVLPIANGGTNSATQNWVDLSTNQTGIAGNKTWTGLHTYQAGLNTSGNITQAAWGLNGPNIQTIAANYTDNSTAAGATVTNAMINTIGIPTITATNATSGSKVTYTNAATVYIAGVPVAGTNTLLTTPLALSVVGNSNFTGTTTVNNLTSAAVVNFSNGSMSLSSAGATTNLSITSASGVGSQTSAAPFLPSGASQVNYGVGIGGVSSTLPVGNSYGRFIVSGAPMATNTSGTSVLLAGTIFMPPAFALGTGSTTTNVATVEIDGPATTTGAGTLTNPALSLFVKSGNSQFNGNLTLGTAGNRLFITEGSNGGAGQTTLVSGTKAITVTGLTTSSRAIVTLVSQGGTVSTTVAYAGVCTSNTLTITALTSAGSTDTTDTSVLNYLILN